MKENKPWYWIPFLNFTSGFPYAIIIYASVTMYKDLGVDNQDIGFYTSLLYLPWVIKPIWSPFIDLYATKRKWFLAMQLLIAITFLIVGITISNNHFFILSLALFWVGAFASASNDVASDGYYMLALAKEQQSFFLGIRSTFYRLSILTGNGLIVILAGFLENKFGDNTKAWSYTMIVVALIAISLTIYNFFFTPKVEEIAETEPNQKASFSEIFTSFFQKKQIGIAIAFILLFRLGESQLLKMLTPFLMDSNTKGGMGLATEDVGIIYGTFGVFALLLGGILAGIIISKYGLRKWMLQMFLAMHLPIIGFVLLAYFLPTSVYYIYAAVIAEQFGYGLGFTAFMFYLIYIAEGESKTSHYAIATGFMALGMMLPGMASGFIQEYLGYGNFFIWVFLATIPGLILSQYLDYPDEYGKKVKEKNSRFKKKLNRT